VNIQQSQLIIQQIKIANQAVDWSLRIIMS
jgi:hypothetical protein